MTKNIAIVATSHTTLSNGAPTGCWYEEVAAPYYVWKDKGHNIDIASLAGGEIPFDPASKSGDFLTPDAKKFLDDGTAMSLVKNSKHVDTLDADSYDAIFVPGGHGIAFDGPTSPGLKKLLEAAAAQGKVISAVCHGPCGLVSANGPDGKSILNGKKVTGFSNSEEEAVGKTKLVPFLLEDRMKELGGKYSAAQDWAEHVEVDGKLVTGQNPASSRKLAEEVAKILG